MTVFRIKVDLLCNRSMLFVFWQHLVQSIVFHLYFGQNWPTLQHGLSNSWAACKSYFPDGCYLCRNVQLVWILLLLGSNDVCESHPCCGEGHTLAPRWQGEQNVEDDIAAESQICKWVANARLRELLVIWCAFCKQEIIALLVQMFLLPHRLTK